jgi:PKD repeat protein
MYKKYLLIVLILLMPCYASAGYSYTHIGDCYGGNGVCGYLQGGRAGSLYPDHITQTVSFDWDGTGHVYISSSGTDSVNIWKDDYMHIVTEDGQITIYNDPVSTLPDITSICHSGTNTVYIQLQDVCAGWQGMSATYVAASTTNRIIPAFTSNVTSGNAPLFVQFTDQSTGSPTTWSWNFGDGLSNSTEQNPIHIYSDPGNYSVTLTATNLYGTNSTQKIDYIHVYSLPKLLVEKVDVWQKKPFFNQSYLIWLIVKNPTNIPSPIPRNITIYENPVQPGIDDNRIQGRSSMTVQHSFDGLYTSQPYMYVFEYEHSSDPFKPLREKAQTEGELAPIKDSIMALLDHYSIYLQMSGVSGAMKIADGLDLFSGAVWAEDFWNELGCVPIATYDYTYSADNIYLYESTLIDTDFWHFSGGLLDKKLNDVTTSVRVYAPDKNRLAYSHGVMQEFLVLSSTAIEGYYVEKFVKFGRPVLAYVGGNSVLVIGMYHQHLAEQQFEIAWSPDPDYTQPVVVQPYIISNVENISAGATKDYILSLEKTATHMDSYADATLKYSTASQANDTIWMARLSKERYKYLSLLTDDIHQNHLKADPMLAEWHQLGLNPTVQEIEEVRQNISLNGFPQDQIDLWKSQGYSDQDINSIKDMTLALPDDFVVNYTTVFTNALDLSEYYNSLALDDVTTTLGSEAPPYANFTANNISGQAPLSVQFTDTSLRGPDQWYWEFGDGMNASIQNAEHSYTSAGIYTVNLTVTNSSTGSNTRTKYDFINVTQTVTPPITGIEVILKDSHATGISGANVSYYNGGWKSFGTTGDDGSVTVRLPTNLTQVSFRVNYAGASLDKSQNISSNPVIVFQTINVTSSLNDSMNNPIISGNVSYYASGWKDFGNIDTSGTTTKELLPGNYSFRMSYLGATEDLKQNISFNPVVAFQTINITTLLRDSTNNPITSGNVSYYANGWKDFGSIDTSGITTRELLPGNYSFRMSYLGATEDLKQNISSNPFVTFQTTNVTVELRDGSGTLISSPNAGNVQYYANGWKNFGTTSVGQVSKELLPVNYTFRMTYLGTSNDKTQDISLNPLVTFQTAQPVVTVRLIDSAGSPLTGGNVSYYANGWKNFGTTGIDGNATLNLLPGTYTFRMAYQGTSNDKAQDTGVNPVVIFQTGTNITTVKLIDSNGNAVAGGTVQYYASGWKDFGITDSTGQAIKNLLPGTYSFRMTYANASFDMKQDTSSGPVVFQTTNASVKLINSLGQPIDTGFVQYYANGWRPFGSTINGISVKELLPVQYLFRMTYAFGSNDKSQNVALIPSVIFQTGQVVSTSGNCTQYYTNGWHVFVNGTELLPNKYTFRFKAGIPDKDYNITAGILNYIQ